MCCRRELNRTWYLLTITFPRLALKTDLREKKRRKRVRKGMREEGRQEKREGRREEGKRKEGEGVMDSSGKWKKVGGR